jgi:nucleotide-binding universal stress UspA family protein
MSMREHGDSRELVVVGVDENRASLTAAQYAVWSTAQRNGVLRIVHGYLPHRRTDASAQALMRRLVRTLPVPRELELKLVVEQGPSADVLLRHSSEATQLILGQHHLRLGETVFGTGPASALAAQALSPVVIVPTDYQLQRRPDPVIVALDAETTADAALATGYREAQVRKVDLVLLHLAPVQQLADEGPWTDFAARFADWTASHADVKVRRVILPGDPVDMIVGASPDSSLLVVGRPRDRSVGSWSRSVARAILQHCSCPLAVVPARLSHDQALGRHSASRVRR